MNPVLITKDETMKMLSKACLCLFAAALPIASAVDAAAIDTASNEISIQGVAPRVCNMPDPNATNMGNTAYVSATVTINELISETDASLESWEATLSYPDVMCNYGATLTLLSRNGGLRRSGGSAIPVGGAFLNRIDYTATASWGNLDDLVLNTATHGTSPVSLQASAPNRGDLTVRLQSLPSDLPVAQGQFDDILVVKVGPSI